MFGAGRAIFAWSLDVELLDHAVVDDHRIALRTLAHAVFASVHLEPERLGEGAIAVGEHGDVAGAVTLVPGLHDEWVVDRNAGDLVDALAFELACFLDI